MRKAREEIFNNSIDSYSDNSRGMMDDDDDEMDEVY